MERGGEWGFWARVRKGIDFDVKLGSMCRKIAG
jgi:hypothetical protein